MASDLERTCFGDSCGSIGLLIVCFEVLQGENLRATVEIFTPGRKCGKSK